MNRKYAITDVAVPAIGDNNFGYPSVLFSLKSSWTFPPFLGAFAKLRKATIRFVMSVHPSVLMEQLGSHWKDFHEILYLRIFRKSVEKIQVSIKSHKNSLYFTWRPIYIFYQISLNSSENDKHFRKTLWRKLRHILYSVNSPPPHENPAVYDIIWKNTVECGRPQKTIWRMRIARWIPMATNRQTGCVIFIVFPL
jgi:hypothetical protein